jgi:hypothetical protein
VKPQKIIGRTAKLLTRNLGKPEKTHEPYRCCPRWREENGYSGRGGVIVLFEGNVQSWVDALRNPEHWQPGCIAIDEKGGSWTAIAGNQNDGALLWLPNDPV